PEKPDVLATDATLTSHGEAAAPAREGIFRTTVLPRVTIEGGREVVVRSPRQRYVEERQLGAGAVGEVHLARDNDIDRPVAIKRLKADRSDLASQVRFAEEIRTVGRLEHPNIVPVHDVGIDEKGNQFFV